MGASSQVGKYCKCDFVEILAESGKKCSRLLFLGGGNIFCLLYGNHTKQHHEFIELRAFCPKKRTPSIDALFLGKIFLSKSVDIFQS